MWDWSEETLAWANDNDVDPRDGNAIAHYLRYGEKLMETNYEGCPCPSCETAMIVVLDKVVCPNCNHSEPKGDYG